MLIEFLCELHSKKLDGRYTRTGKRNALLNYKKFLDGAESYYSFILKESYGNGHSPFIEPMTADDVSAVLNQDYTIRDLVDKNIIHLREVVSQSKEPAAFVFVTTYTANKELEEYLDKLSMDKP